MEAMGVMYRPVWKELAPASDLPPEGPMVAGIQGLVNASGFRGVDAVVIAEGNRIQPPSSPLGVDVPRAQGPAW